MRELGADRRERESGEAGELEEDLRGGEVGGQARSETRSGTLFREGWCAR